MSWLNKLLSGGASKTAPARPSRPEPPTLTERDVIMLQRKYAGKYQVGSWSVDATPELHLSIMSDSSIYGFCLEGGSVLKVSHEPPLSKPSVWHIEIYGTSICPKCGRDRRFIGSIFKNTRGSYDDSCNGNRCMECDVMVDPNIFQCIDPSTFYLAVRRRIDSASSRGAGPWTVCSARIDQIRVHDRERTSEESDEHFRWLMNK